MLASLPVRLAFRLPNNLHRSRGLFAQPTGWLHNQGPAANEQGPFTYHHEINEKVVGHSIGDGLRTMVSSHTFTCPLDYNDPKNSADSTVKVHATVVDLLPPNSPSSTVTAFLNAHASGEEAAEAYLKLFHPDSQPNAPATKSLLYLQGGPGFPAPRPNVALSLASGGSSSWASAALAKGFNRLVLMDQRGTGRSQPITKQTLSLRFDLSADTENISDYMSKFRAPEIVADAEVIRQILHTDPASPWDCVLGQSFGGFCLATYLTSKSGAIKNALFTGGVPPLTAEDPKDVYDALIPRVIARNNLYYETYPGDVPLVKRIVQSLMKAPAPLPCGGMLTARRFLQLGMALGGGPGSFENLHDLLVNAFLDGTDVLSKNFLRQVQRTQPFDTNPIYALLHESIYLDGPGKSSEWAAHRSFSLHPCSEQFNYEARSESKRDSEPVLFFGEMVFPFMFEDYEEVREEVQQIPWRFTGVANT